MASQIFYRFKINAFKVDKKKTYQPMGIQKYGIKTIIIRYYQYGNLKSFRLFNTQS